MKKRIFIGSSLESKKIAELLRDELSSEFDCVLWHEGFFSLGNHYYTDLVQKIITFDLAIMIGGEDDRVIRISNNDEKTSPRDNVYLEYGLFSGILSPSKVLLLIHENCKAASDLLGMSLLQYGGEEQAVAVAKAWVNNVTEPKGRALSRKDIGLMPTASVAVGYYYNFLKPFVEKLAESDIDREIRLTVFVPTTVSDDVSSYKKELILRKRLKEEVIQKYRILTDPRVEDALQMYDVPSTILTLFKTVNFIFGVSDGNTEDTMRAKQRALDDFYDNLSLLVADDYIARNIVRIERYDGNK